jgi:hypothetical protein
MLSFISRLPSGAGRHGVLFETDSIALCKLLGWRRRARQNVSLIHTPLAK